MTRKIIKTLRSIFIFRITYRIAKLIIPIFIYLSRSMKSPELIRFAIPWISSNLDPNRSPIKDERPWITFQAKEWLESFLTQNKDLIVFEYGSSGSTIFFSEKVKRVISVEHNRNWHRYMSTILQKKKYLKLRIYTFGTATCP